MLLSLIAITFWTLGIVSAVHAAMTARTATGAVAWVMALVSFPFLAVPAYWVFGRSKFQGFVDAYEANRGPLDETARLITDNLRGEEVSPAHIPAYVSALRQLTGNALVGRNEVELLVNGEATFDSLLEGIERARHYVLVQFYILRDDDIGRRLQAALLDRARAGIRIYLLYDEVGCLGLPGSYCDALRDAGAEVSSFQPTRGRNNRFQINFRNHRKIVVVDGESGWVGGHNVGDEYLGRDPKFSPWRDTHVRLRGPVVIQLQRVIATDWYWATRELPELRWTPNRSAAGNTSAMIIPSGPTQRLETAGLMYVAALNRAERRIWLTAPYFVPDEAVMKALELASLRGVDIRILVPGTSDSVLANLASYFFIGRLAQLGIHFAEYRPGFLHQKVALVDEHTALIGTANFDNRSFRLNFEVTALVHDTTFAATVEAMLEADFRQAETLDPESLKDRSFWWRLKVSLARLLAPIL